jgi:hypothetical protein
VDRSGANADCYLEEKLRHAFASDPRLNELELEVEIDGDRILVTGAVQTLQRKQAVSEVAHDVAPDHVIQNRIRVLEHGARGTGPAVP